MVDPGGVENLRPDTEPVSIELVARVAGLTGVNSDIHVSGVTHDSRRVESGDLYVGLPGANVHGAAYVQAAWESGAVAVLTDSEGAELIDESIDILTLIVEDPRAILGPVAASIYGNPSDDLVMIGITGTDGKTTTAMLIESALNGLGVPAGLIGTVSSRLGEWSVPSTRTTPEATDLHAILALMRQRGAHSVVLEVSSHAIALERVGGIQFDIAVFTNLGMDHLDFHKTQEHYFETKARLFDARSSKVKIINVGGAWGRELASRQVEDTELYGIDINRSSLDGELSTLPAWEARKLVASTKGWTYDLHYSQVDGTYHAGTKLPGSYNVENAVAAVAAVSWAKEFDDKTGSSPSTNTCEQAVASVASSAGVPGRMEIVDVGQDFTMLVDYAHTPEAVERALESVGELTHALGGRVITVIGCGGDRDTSKRPDMGRIAAERSDVVVVTDDNPRSEDPELIRRALLDGISIDDANRRATVVTEQGDRALAISLAVGQAQPGDVVIALGKGHEVGQEVNGTIIPMNDQDLLAEAARALDRTS